MRRGLFGVRSICKICTSVATMERARKLKETNGFKIPETKKCCSCGETKIASDFNKGTGITGLHSSCKACQRRNWKERNAANPIKTRVQKSNRRARKLNATPKWLTPAHYAEIEGFYLFCKLFPGHHVDHIAPLKGKNVCGLHHPLNLQILTAEENMKKGNRFSD